MHIRSYVRHLSVFFHGWSSGSRLIVTSYKIVFKEQRAKQKKKKRHPKPFELALVESFFFKRLTFVWIHLKHPVVPYLVSYVGNKM